MTSAPAIGFEYRPSRWIPCLLIVVTALAMPAIALSSLPRVLQTVLAVGVLILCGRALRRLRVPVSAVGWANQGGWSLHGLDGADEPATLLSFKVIQTAVLLPDNSDADIRRRLRMRLAVLQADVGESTP
jgi:toxin CptA